MTVSQNVRFRDPSLDCVMRTHNLTPVTYGGTAIGHNIAYPALGGYRITRTNTVGNVGWTGFGGGTDSRCLILFNDPDSVAPWWLYHDNAGSAAANRMQLPNDDDYAIQPGGGVVLQYDDEQSRWLMIAEVDDAAAQGVTADFWRSPSANGALPDGAADVTEDIARTGDVGIGLAAGAAPVAQLDVASVARSGTHASDVPATAFYATATSAAWPTDLQGDAPAQGGATIASLFHSNGTQGFDVLYNAIIHRSSATANQLVTRMATTQPNHQHARAWKGWHATGSKAYDRYLNADLLPATAGAGWQRDWIAGNLSLAQVNIAKPVAANRPVANTNLQYELLLNQQGGANALRLAHKILPAVNTMTHTTGAAVNNFTHFFNGYAGNAHAATLVFYAMDAAVLTDGADAGDGWAGIGTIAGPGGFTHGVVHTQGREDGPFHFVGDPSRISGLSGTATAGQTSILSLWDDGAQSRVKFGLGLPVYDSNAAAVGGGLGVGEMYRTSVGVVHVVI